MNPQPRCQPPGEYSGESKCSFEAVKANLLPMSRDFRDSDLPAGYPPPEGTRPLRARRRQPAAAAPPHQPPGGCPRTPQPAHQKGVPARRRAPASWRPRPERFKKRRLEKSGTGQTAFPRQGMISPCAPPPADAIMTLSSLLIITMRANLLLPAPGSILVSQNAHLRR